MSIRLIIAFSAILVLANAANIRRGNQDSVVVVQSGAPVVVVSPEHQSRPQRPGHNRGPHPFPVGPNRRQSLISNSQPVAVVVPVPVAPIVVGSGHSHRHHNGNHNQRPF